VPHELFFTPELHDSFCQPVDPRRGVSAWAALALLPIVQGHGSVNGFLVARKNQLKGHFFDVPWHVTSAGRLNAVAFYVCALILKV